MRDPWRDGNSVELLINGEEYFPKVFDAIRRAKHEVLLETFILYEDKVGHELREVLIEAAQRGVKIDLTVDDYGTADLSKEFTQAMIEAGVRLHLFDPTPRLFGLRINILRRLHRKLVVVDAQEAFVGGINFSVDHLAISGPESKQDYAVRVRGPIVNDIRRTCLHLLHGKRKAKQMSVKAPGPANDPAQKDSDKTVGNVRMLLAVRDNIWHTKDIERHYMRAINSAKKRLVIANAYFFPGYKLLRALRLAAQRNVKVTLILQGQPDMPWVSACSRLLYGYLLHRGVEIYEYCQRPLHGKVALADDQWATVGSSNLDPLSLALNLEANLVIEDGKFNQMLHDHLIALVKSHCKPVDIKTVDKGHWWRLPLVFLSFHFLRTFPVVAGWLPTHSPDIQQLGPVEAIKQAAAPNKNWKKTDVLDEEKLT